MEENQFSVSSHSSALSSFFARSIGSKLSEVESDRLFLRNLVLLKATFCE